MSAKPLDDGPAGMVPTPTSGEERAARPSVSNTAAERAEELSLLNRKFDGPAVVMAGPANVIMQLAWPEVGYGVLAGAVESGSVMRHPFKRFRTTIGYIGIAMYGNEEQRASYRQAVNGAHRQVRSAPDSPVKYNAFNRDLQLWVASCLHYGLLDMIQRLHGPLSGEEEEILLRVGSRFGTTLQVPPEMWHTSPEQFWAYWEDGLKRSSIDQPVADYLLAVLHMEMLPFPLQQILGPPLAWLNTGCIPEPFRAQLGLTWTALDERRHRRIMRTTGTLMRPLPHIVRRFPVNAMTANIKVRRRLGRRLV